MEHGFYLNPDTDLLVFKDFHQQRDWFGGSFWAILINCDINDLLFSNIDVFILRGLLLTTLFRELEVVDQDLATSVSLNQVGRYSGKLLLEFILLLANTMQYPLLTFYRLFLSVPTFT